MNAHITFNLRVYLLLLGIKTLFLLEKNNIYQEQKKSFSFKVVSYQMGNANQWHRVQKADEQKMLWQLFDTNLRDLSLQQNHH